MSSAIEEEEEILLSIFPEEFEKLNASTFKIRVDIDPSECKVKSPPVLHLTTQLPSNYPEIAPILHIESIPSEEGEDLAGDERDELLKRLYVLAEENLGMAMVFTLVSAFKEEAIMVLDERIERAEAQKAEAARAAERQEQKRFEGTKVTVESFNAWNQTFKNEMARKKLQEEDEQKKQAAKLGGPVEKKLTGRQLFEGDKTLAQSDLQIGDATDVEFDFSKYDKTTRNLDEEEEEVRHWAAE